MKGDACNEIPNATASRSKTEVKFAVKTADSYIIAHPPKCCPPVPAETCTCLAFTNFLPITVITILYFVFLSTTLSIVEAAPNLWVDACGIYVSAEEYPSHGPFHSGEKNRALCELRGNLSKQIVSLRRFMGPKNFSKVWGKHNNSYAFLKVANGKNITLRTWLKQLQVYVTTADHLYERAYNYKILQRSTWISSKEHINKADKDLQRLRNLIITARSIMCDLELTANLLVKRRIPNIALKIDKSLAMPINIQLKSDKRTDEEGVDPIDINMLYQRLRRSLLNMRKPLKSYCGKSRKRAKEQRRKKNKKEKHKWENVSKMNKELRNQGYKSKTTNQRRKTKHKWRHQQNHLISPLYR